MSFEHFLRVRDGQIQPRFQQLKGVKADGNDWMAHRDALSRWRYGDCNSDRDNTTKFSLLDLKIELAEEMLDSCDLCPHHCFVNRNAGKVGYCGVANKAAVHWEGILHGEEIELVPSHEVFLSGCTMRCAFCYSHEYITKPMSGTLISPQKLAHCATARRREGAINLNLVGGEPIVHIAHILKALRELQVPQPIVWNSNMYATSQAMELLDGVVDLFVGDVHFGNDECAQNLGKIPHYFASVTQAFEMAYESGASIIIRHLLMPGHLDCCTRPAMSWAKENLPDVPFHLMFQYRPDFRALGDPVLGRTLTFDEVEAARKMAKIVGVKLYEEHGQVSGSVENASEIPFIGDEIEVVLHDDGRVSITRLTQDLMPLAYALEEDNVRLLARLGS